MERHGLSSYHPCSAGISHYDWSDPGEAWVKTPHGWKRKRDHVAEEQAAGGGARREGEGEVAVNRQGAGDRIDSEEDGSMSEDEGTTDTSVSVGSVDDLSEGVRTPGSTGFRERDGTLTYAGSLNDLLMEKAVTPGSPGSLAELLRENAGSPRSTESLGALLSENAATPHSVGSLEDLLRENAATPRSAGSVEDLFRGSAASPSSSSSLDELLGAMGGMLQQVDGCQATPEADDKLVITVEEARAKWLVWSNKNQASPNTSFAAESVHKAKKLKLKHTRARGAQRVGGDRDDGSLQRAEGDRPQGTGGDMEDGIAQGTGGDREGGDNPQGTGGDREGGNPQGTGGDKEDGSAQRAEGAVSLASVIARENRFASLNKAPLGNVYIKVGCTWVKKTQAHVEAEEDAGMSRDERLLKLAREDEMMRHKELSRCSRPYVVVSRGNTKEQKVVISTAEALARLDMAGAVKDIRRFSYVCKLLDILIKEKLHSLSGTAQKIVFNVLEEALTQAIKTNTNMRTVEQLVRGMGVHLNTSQHDHVGCSSLWARHKETVCRMQNTINNYHIAQREEDGKVTMSDLPDECIHHILARLSDHRDLVHAGLTEMRTFDLSEHDSLWRNLCLFHFTHTQWDAVLKKDESVESLGWKRLYTKLVKRYGQREVYGEMLHLCRHCNSLFWSLHGHPCLVPAMEPVSIPINPSTCLELFNA